MRWILFVMFAVGVAHACREPPLFQEAGPLAETTTGSIVGKYVKVFDTDVAAFLGIPFGEPPVGQLRFSLPKPAAPWTGLRAAQTKPPPCPQWSPVPFAWLPTTSPSEDCLQLNVWAPARCSGGRPLPVMVWIHGGAFIMGSTDMDVYDGAVLASYGDVVVVSANYRLGAFGLLNAGTEDAPGNAALYDQLLALQWVRDNIASFGGDPDRVTIFGESAGAWSVSLHLVSPLSKGLFKRALMQSGSMYHPATSDAPEVAKQKTTEFAKLAGCGGQGDEMLKCLRGKDFEELAKLENGLTTRSVVYFLPTYGDSFLPVPPITAYESGQLPADVDVLSGTTKDEGTLFLPAMAPEVFRFDAALPALTRQQAESVTRTLFQMMPKQAVDAVVDYYFNNLNATEDGKEPEYARLVADALGDSFFHCPTVFLAEKVASGPRLYWLTYAAEFIPSAASWLGVPHFSDVPYVFGAPIVDGTRYSPEDGKFSGDLIRMWANFARDGHPLKDDAGSWPAFTHEDPVAMELNPRASQLITHPRFEVCDRLWRHLYTPTPSASSAPLNQEHIEA
ncbi:hypothetical protein JTE90_017840 [Oedothorax gibbosus]|uniref:Carboxylic ester hydrolase n=1 Tax=Oedothorax gibbosus TaxID=931172 RepID=A0AAV6VAU5_9ARAC|nr:hypothetical protein JTE90_017840 [Oedothorax gibbosus]